MSAMLALRRLSVRPLLTAGLALVLSTTPGPGSTPSAAAASDDFILMPRAELMALPTSGPGWSNVVDYAGRSAPSPTLADQDDPDNVVVLAKALVAARTGNESLREEVLVALRAIPGTENGGRTLALARELGSYVLAADLVGYRDPSFVSWLTAVRSQSLEGRTLISTHEDRPNNWGTHAGATRAIVARYLGDTVDLARAALVFRGFVGDRSAYAGFEYGDLSWQASSGAPVGINPKAAVKDGVDLDGIMPDDMRRGGTFPAVGADGLSYTWEALQGALLQAEILTRAGYPAYAWQEAAILRAFARINALGSSASGDDAFQPWLINFRYGTNYPTTTARPGKAFGFTDWLYGGRSGGTAPPAKVDEAAKPTTRLAGVDRYATAVAISQAYFEAGVPVVFVAVGTDFPDALAGSAAAARLGGPILLVRSTAIPLVVRAELARLKPASIVILGGTGVVSSTVENELARFVGPGKVSRVAGGDRYATAVVLSRTYFSPGVPAVFVATGQNYPDALAASAVAGMIGAPVLLVPPGTLRSDIAAELTRLAPRHIYILGGTGVVSTGIENQLAAMFGSSSVARVAGADRYSTATAVSRAFFGPNRGAVFVATGSNFPDAIAGAVPAGRTGGPILLVRDAVVPVGVADELARLHPEVILVLGGVAW